MIAVVRVCAVTLGSWLWGSTSPSARFGDRVAPRLLNTHGRGDAGDDYFEGDSALRGHSAMQAGDSLHLKTAYVGAALISWYKHG